MQANTHYEMAKLVISKTERKLPRWNLTDREYLLFLKGAIKPDRSLDVFLLPHFYIKSGEEIFKRIEDSLGGKFSPKDAGIIMHYLMDYSTKVHRAKGLVKPAEHIIYERNLNEFFKVYRKELKRREVIIPEKEDLVGELRRIIETYHASRPTYELDLSTAFDLCVKTLVNIVRESF